MTPNGNYASAFAFSSPIRNLRKTPGNPAPTPGNPLPSAPNPFILVTGYSLITKALKNISAYSVNNLSALRQPPRHRR